MAWIDALLSRGSCLADEVEVFFAEGTSVSADLRQTRVHLATRSDDCGLAIRTIRDGRIGVSSTNDPARWEECLDAALASGQLATPQKWGGLPARSPGQEMTDLLCFDPALKPDPRGASRLLSGMLDGAKEHPAQVTSGSASLSSSSVTIANSSGLEVTGRQTGVSVSLEAIAGQSTGSEFSQSCFLDVDPAAVGERAAFFASRSAGGVDILTGTYDIVLSPIAYAELLGAVFVPALSGRNVHAGRSRLAGLMNQEVAGTGFSLYDDPLRPRGLCSALWDAEGVPARRIDFVRDGILTSFAYDLRTAYRYGTESTGSAVRSGASGGTGIGHHNLIIDGPRRDIMQEEAIYIHSVVGAHTANPMSGDFSVEMSNAFRVEAGEFGKPIRSAMLAGNVFDMHRAVGGFSEDVRQIGSFVLPSVRFTGMRVIGK